MIWPHCLDVWLSGAFLGALRVIPRAARVVASMLTVAWLSDQIQVVYKKVPAAL